jgi:hypothetical protein
MVIRSRAAARMVILACGIIAGASFCVDTAMAQLPPPSDLAEMRRALAAADPPEPMPDTAGLKIDAAIDDSGALILRFHNGAATPIGLDAISASMPRHPICTRDIPPMRLDSGESREWRQDHCVNNIPAGWHVRMNLAFGGARLIWVGPSGDQNPAPRGLPSEIEDPNASRLLTRAITLDQQHAARQFALKWGPVLVPWTPP